MLRDLLVSAYLVNCSKPESISAAVPKMTALGGFPVGAYTNGFTHIPNKRVLAMMPRRPKRVSLSIPMHMRILRDNECAMVRELSVGVVK